MMRKGLLRGAGILSAALVGVFLAWLLAKGGHDPNRGINLEQARAAAGRVHATPPPGFKHEPGFGG